MDASELENHEVETRVIEVCGAGAGEAEPPEAAVPKMEAPELGEAEAHAAEAPAAGASEVEARAEEAHTEEEHGDDAQAWEAQLGQNSLEEDETQLAAIRELMMRAFSRGVWLSLGEIAEATEFGEASISAQLRHLRKRHHGGHRVEKRRRRPAGAAAAGRKIGDARRGPVIWEYRVLPPGGGDWAGKGRGKSRFLA